MEANNIVIARSRERTIAALLALFTGGFGIQKFYLGQITLGVLSIIFSFTFIPMLIGFIDFIRFMVMSDAEFDLKYNSKIMYNSQVHRTKNGTIVFKKNEREAKSFEYTSPQAAKRTFSKSRYVDPLQLKKAISAGDEFFETYRYSKAIEAYRDAFKYDPHNSEIYFKIACCNSLLEQKSELFENLQLAIRSGYTDMKKIMTTDALAYFRIQPEYDAIQKSNFMQWPTSEKVDQGSDFTPPNAQDPMEKTELSMDELLVQLKKLGELRQNGVLTDEEFSMQKRKLFA